MTSFEQKRSLKLKLAAFSVAIFAVLGCTSTKNQKNDQAGAASNPTTQTSSELDSDLGLDDPESADEGSAPGDNQVSDLPEEELDLEEGGADSQAATVDVLDLRYLSKSNGGTIVVRTSGRASYRIREIPEQRQVVLEIANAKLPARLKRPFITREFNQAVSAINAYQEAGSTTARFVVQLRSQDRLRVEQTGNEIFLAPESLAAADSIAMQPGVASGDTLPSDLAGGAAGSGNEFQASGSSNRPAPRDGLPLSGGSLDELNYSNMRFYGKPISIEVRDTDIADVINFISEQSGANLVLADGVTGKISLKLKQVPWDQALLLIMKSKQLGYIRQGNILRIAPLAQLQAETESARKVLEAQREAEPVRVRVVPVSYANVTQLATQVKEFLSNNRGKVVADVRTSSLIITDIIENIERATNLVRALDVPPLQVQIEAKVIEASENFSRNLGINWSILGGQIPAGGDAIFEPNLRITPGTVDPGGLNLGLRVGRFDALGDLSATLGLFELNQEIKIVSAPRIVTMNNEKATISQVQQVPFQTATQQGNVLVNTVQTKDVKLALDVTPQITSDSDVIMTVTINRDLLGASPAGVNAPTVNTRQASTKVMVQNGQTAVIGGIYQNDETSATSAVPWISRVPILGWLFKSRNTSQIKNELLLFLTPRILNASEGTVKSGEL